MLQDVQKKEGKGTFWNNEISVGRGVLFFAVSFVYLCVLMKNKYNEKICLLRKGFI